MRVTPAVAVTSACCSVLSKHKGNCGDTRWPPGAACLLPSIGGCWPTAELWKWKCFRICSPNALSKNWPKKQKRKTKNKKISICLRLCPCCLGCELTAQCFVPGVKESSCTSEQTQARRLEGSSVLQTIWSLEFTEASVQNDLAEHVFMSFQLNVAGNSAFGTICFS